MDIIIIFQVSYLSGCRDKQRRLEPTENINLSQEFCKNNFSAHQQANEKRMTKIIEISKIQKHKTNSWLILVP